MVSKINGTYNNKKSITRPARGKASRRLSTSSSTTTDHQRRSAASRVRKQEKSSGIAAETQVELFANNRNAATSPRKTRSPSGKKGYYEDDSTISSATISSLLTVGNTRTPHPADESKHNLTVAILPQEEIVGDTSPKFQKAVRLPDEAYVTESDATALVDRNLGLRLYIGPHCMQMAIDKAKKHGVGFVACRNSTHYGIAGYYDTMASSQGCVGLTGTNARPSIAPTFGTEPMMGTNPLTFGIPSSNKFPFVIDCAMSVNQRGKIKRYAREGVDTPRGCVIDDQGVERTDTEGILRDMVLGTCTLTPVGGAGDKIGGYKCYGWATTVELLCTAFGSGPWGEAICGVDRATGQPKSMLLGHFFLAIDIEKLCLLDTFKKNTGEFLEALQQSRKTPEGPGRIWTAGEPENDARVQRNAQGGMKVNAPLQKI